MVRQRARIGSRRTRPVVNIDCVADQYSSAGERIVEFFSRRCRAGGLISLVERDDGGLVVQVYCCDPKVRVLLPKQVPAEQVA